MDLNNSWVIQSRQSPKDSKRDSLFIVVGLFTAVLPTFILVTSLNSLFFIPFVVGLLCAIFGSIKMRPIARKRVGDLARIILQ